MPLALFRVLLDILYVVSQFFIAALYPEDRKTPHTAQLSYLTSICLNEDLATYALVLLLSKSC
jgi:hypothetical protein